MAWGVVITPMALSMKASGGRGNGAARAPVSTPMGMCTRASGRMIGATGPECANLLMGRSSGGGGMTTDGCSRPQTLGNARLRGPGSPKQRLGKKQLLPFWPEMRLEIAD